MGTINQAFVLGHLGTDPEFQVTQAGLARATLSVATHSPTGKETKEVTWHKVKVWRKNAEIAREHLKKGDCVAISGRIVHEEWKDHAGESRRTTVIIADRLTLVGRRPTTGV